MFQWPLNAGGEAYLLTTVFLGRIECLISGVDYLFLPEGMFSAPWHWLVLAGMGCWLTAMTVSVKPLLAGVKENLALRLNREG